MFIYIQGVTEETTESVLITGNTAQDPITVSHQTPRGLTSPHPHRAPDGAVRFSCYSGTISLVGFKNSDFKFRPKMLYEEK